MTKAFKADLDALLLEWAVWRVVRVQDTPDPATGLLLCEIERTDEGCASMRLRINYSRSYPTGSLSIANMTRSATALCTTKNLHLSEALDLALQQWEDDDGQDLRNPADEMDDQAVEGCGGAHGSEGHARAGCSDPAVLQMRMAVEVAATRLVATSSENTSYSSDVAFCEDDCFTLRIVLPVASLSGAIACRALGLDVSTVLCVSLVMTDRLALNGEMQFRSLFACDPKEARGVNPASANADLGALQWYYASNFGSILRRRHFSALEEDIAPKPLTVVSQQPPSWLATQFDAMLDVERKPFLIALHDFAVLLFRCCTTRCSLCDEPLPYAGVKMGVCVKPICNFSMEQFGLGVDVMGEIRKNPEVVELLIYFSCAAAASSLTSTRSTFTPMCPVNLGAGPSGAATARGGPTHFFEDGHFGEPGSKNHKLLLETIQKMPPLSVMKERSGGTNQGLRQYLSAEDPLLYPLLQWIISSNRSYIELLKPCDAVGNLGRLQFHLVTCNPQKEKVFQEYKRQAAKKGPPGSRGSLLGWHGSSCYNWHAILREGLKNYSGTKMMSTGQMYGSGIYLANSLLTSQAYMGLPEHPWKNAVHLAAPQTAAGASSKLAGCTVISLCEFVDNPKYVQFHAEGDIVTVQHEDLVVTRFLFVFPGGLRGGVNLLAKDLTPHCWTPLAGLS